MKHPNKPGTHKITVRNDDFFVTTVDDTRFEEVPVSQKERALLACRVGYVNGELPGLVEDFCRTVARKMRMSRTTRAFRRNNRRA